MADIREYRIVISERPSYNERRAAAFISNAVKVATGKRLVLVTDAAPSERYELVIGKTRREEECGIDFCRDRAGAKSFRLKYTEGKLFITHLGTPSEDSGDYDPARIEDNGDYGLMYAAYYFTDFILGYRCVVPSLQRLSDKGAIEIDESCDYDYTREFFSTHLPKRFDGAAMYFIPASAQPNITQCNVFKTRTGKLVVLDGGVADNAEHLLSVLEYLSDGKKPTVSAWFLSHLHGDHYGAYLRISQTPALAKRVKVESFYCDLPDDEDFLRIGEGVGWAKGVTDALLTEYEQTGVKVCKLYAGERIAVDEMVFEVVHAPSEILSNTEKPYLCTNINDTSVVLKLHYDGKQTILFLTDAEASCSIDLLKNHREQLGCDVVQYGHHGGQSVSKECYAATGARMTITPQGVHGWFCDSGEAPSQTELGIRRSLSYMCDFGVEPERIFCDMFGTLSFELPIDIENEKYNKR